MSITDEEYLNVPQVAFLLGRKRYSTEKLITRGLLQADIFQKRRLVSISALERYVTQETQKYDLAKEYLAEPEKKQFWKSYGYRGISVEKYAESADEFLTIPQVAFLLGITRQCVNKHCENGTFQVQQVSLPGSVGKTRKLIPVSELKCYVKNKLKRLEKAKKYLNTTDKFGFWIDFEEEFYNEFILMDRENYRKYGKIQKNPGKKGETRKRKKGCAEAAED
ncbi:MAG: hypothetical protein J6K58_06745 [Lachnospiraceae bacterium]|nr:hypothetical protein [Lachnospiraceae bacterium]MBP3458889.1 hypothetical protein [Lachnospiraceae bacterium]